jgi:tripartite-type tricarboxylate transporter receptor subunit TctC
MSRSWSVHFVFPALFFLAGAGGLIAANYLARQAPRDGLTLGFIGMYTVLPQLIDEPGVQYDVRQFRALSAPGPEDSDVCVTGRSSGLTLSDWRSRSQPPRLGVTIRGSANHAIMMLLSAALRLPIRVVAGYKGTAEVRLAMENGEIDGTCLGFHAYETTFAATGQYAIVLQSGTDPSPMLRDVPSAERLVNDAHGRELLDLLTAIRALDRYFVAPPGTPAQIVDLLRAGFEATMSDGEFLAQARLAHLVIRPLPSADIDARVVSVLNLPDESRRELAGLLKAQIH